jgi:hypothetical protein
MISFDGGAPQTASLSGRFSLGQVNTDLTMCGLLVDRAEELTHLYASHGNWNDVEATWFDERLSNRSTKDSSRKIYRVLTSRFKNSPASLPKPSVLPIVFNLCRTEQDKAQILYLYLVSDDPLVRYVVHEYVIRISNKRQARLDFSDDTLTEMLERFEYADGTSLDYAESTLERWCEGFRSVMREVGVLEPQQIVADGYPSIGKIPLLVAMGYSYREGDENWTANPRGIQYLFQPESHWQELFDRVAQTDAWEYLEVHGELTLRPTTEPYSWASTEGDE